MIEKVMRQRYNNINRIHITDRKVCRMLTLNGTVIMNTKMVCEEHVLTKPTSHSEVIWNTFLFFFFKYITNLTIWLLWS